MKKLYVIFLTLIAFSFSFSVEYKELYPYLIDLEGWDGKAPSGKQSKTFFGEMLSVERSYTKDDKSLKVSIVKGSMVMAMWMPFSMVIEEDTPDKFMKTFEIEGFKSAVDHNKKENYGKVIIMVAPTAAFMLEYRGFKNYKEAIELAKKFPLKKISMKLM